MQPEYVIASIAVPVECAGLTPAELETARQALAAALDSALGVAVTVALASFRGHAQAHTRPMPPKPSFHDAKHSRRQK